MEEGNLHTIQLILEYLGRGVDPHCDHWSVAQQNQIQQIGIQINNFKVIKIQKRIFPD
jgi:hypothetical protein